MKQLGKSFLSICMTLFMVVGVLSGINLNGYAAETGQKDTGTISADAVGDYVLTDTLEGGKQYLIATKNSGSAYILSSEEGSELKGYSVNIANDTITLGGSIDESKVAFNCELQDESNKYSTFLTNGGKYLYVDSGQSSGSPGTLRMDVKKEGRFWHYVAKDGDTDKNLLYFFQDAQDTTTGTHGYTWAGATYRYYVDYTDSGDFKKGQLTSSTTSLANTTTPKVYLFEKVVAQVDVTSVKIEPATASVAAGKSIQLTGSVEPEEATVKKLTWASDKTNIATVDENGKVKGVSEGTAEITATSNNGKSATCTVTVTPNNATKYELTTELEDGSNYLIVNSKTAGTAYALKNPGGSSSGVQISTDDKTEVTIEDSEIIRTDDGDIVWTAEENKDGVSLVNDGSYVEGYYSNGEKLYVFKPRKYDDRYWTYSGSEQLQHQGGTSAYTLCYSSNKFSTTRTSGNTEKVYLFREIDTSVTRYDVTLAAGLTGKDSVKEGGTYKFTKSADADDYNYGDVTYTMGGGASKTVTPDANGTYSIANVTGALVISCTRTAKPKTTYELTDTLKAGDKFIIASANSGSAKLLYHDGEDVKTMDVTVAESSGKKTISTSKTSAVLTASTNGDGFTFKDGDYYFTLEYLQGGTNSSKLQYSTTESTKYWLYSGYQLTCSSSQSPRYLYYSSSNSAFVATTSGTDHYAYVYVEKSDSPAPHEHTYGTPSYKWADDNSTCTATATCTGCTEGTDGHTVSETVNSSYSVTTDATCTAVGTGKYTAAFTNALFAAQTKNVEIAKKAHTLTAHAAVEAKCTTAGNSAYWSCSVCGKYFSDAEGKTEIAANSWVIDALGHNWSDWEVTKEATETAEGEKSRTCSRCNLIETEKIPATAHVHSLTEVAAKAATCTEAGNKQYWVCDKGTNPCNKYFSDAEGTQEITDKESVVIAAAGHNMTAHEAKAATCTEAGNSAYWSCDKCSKYFSDEAGTEEIEENDWVIKATGHNLTPHEAKAADCKTAGNSAYWSCDKCGKYFGDAEGTEEIEADSWNIPAKGHTWGEWTVTKPATESEAGEETRTCSVCQETETKVIPVVGHEHGLTEVPAKDATCTEKGNIQYWVCDQGEHACGLYFADADATTSLDKEDIFTEAKGHTLTLTSAKDATCTEAGNKAYYTCSECGKFFSYEDNTQEIEENSWVTEALGHTWGEWTVTKPATETEKGEETRTCSVCKATEKRDIEVIGHVHSLTAVAAKAATCTEAGNSAYWICSKCGKYFSDAEGNTEIEADSWTIAALGHDWSEWKVTKEATETAEGEKTRTCSRCNLVDKEIIPKVTPTPTPQPTPTPSPAPTPSPTPTPQPTPANPSQPTAAEFANAKVDNTLPVINPEKIKTTASMSKKTMTIQLGTLNADNCLVEYRQAGAKTWTSVWYGKGASQLVVKGMKKNGYYQYRFTAVKLVNGEWRKGKTSNTCYRWIKNIKAKKPVAGKKSFTFKWTKVKKSKGYEIQYATNKAFTKNAKKVTVKGAKKTSKTIKGLKKGKTYYVRIRPYATKGGKKYLGIYTVAKKVKVK